MYRPFFALGNGGGAQHSTWGVFFFENTQATVQVASKG